MSNDLFSVLFVCVHNSGRSQMAEAFFNLLAKGQATSCSAGTFPSEKVNDVVVDCMMEIDIDISNKKPNLLRQDMLDNAQKIITMGCNVEDVCPANMVITEDWGLDDPSGQSVEIVRGIRNQVRGRVKLLLEEMGISGLK